MRDDAAAGHLHRLRLVVALAAVVAPLSLSMFLDPGPVSVGLDERPSVVLVVTDDQRFDSLWAMPRVRALLVARGVTFEDAFVVNPLCCPSRASILTGTYSHTTGMYKNRPPFGGMPAFRSHSNVATWLRAAGYRTALVGKFLNGYGEGPTSTVPPGWDRWVGFFGNTSYYHYDLNVDGRIVRRGGGPHDYSTRVLAEAAVDFVRETEGPLFLYFAPNAPHEPATGPPGEGGAPPPVRSWPPPSYDEVDVSDKPRWVSRQLSRLSEERHRYVDELRERTTGALQALDRSIAKIIDVLADTGRLHRTMVIFTSDNGLAWGEHRWIGKVVPYEESIRVPLVVRFDPLTTAPRRDRHLALNIDLAPTIADLAGVRAPGADGRSLLPLLRSPDAPWRRDFLIEHLDPSDQAHRTEVQMVPTYCAVRSRRHAYIAYETGEEELYDLDRDPHQLDNLAKEPEALRLLLDFRDRLRKLCSPPPPGFVAPRVE